MCAQWKLRSAWASAHSDQSLRYPHEDSLGPELPAERTMKTLIRLGECPDWSESSAGRTVILRVLSWGGSYYNYTRTTAVEWLVTFYVRCECPDWSESSAGHTVILLVLSWGGSYYNYTRTTAVEWLVTFMLDANAQTDLSLRWAHSHFVGFVMRRLILQLHQDHRCGMVSKVLC